METITIQVDAEVAKAYREITLVKRQQLENLFNDWFKQMIQSRSVDEIIADMQQQAKTNGLTEEILIAELYQESDSNKKEKLTTIITVFLTSELEQKKLSEVMAEIADKAEQRGLTPEILESILHDDE
jgi:predicted DNA-binding ribbon-helix-helix protein